MSDAQPSAAGSVAASDTARATVVVTGAAGYLGRVVTQRLARSQARVVALDLAAVAPDARVDGVEYLEADVRTYDFETLLRSRGATSVVHMASVVERPRRMSLAEAHAIDVGGTRRILAACVAAGVGQVVVTSSGAAYGYHADTPAFLDEDCALRGAGPFDYAERKRLVEEELARWRTKHPELKQLILRPGTILGAGTKNQITNLFERGLVFGLRGKASPFVFIWDEDVAECVARGVTEGREGIYNLAGDGTLTLRDLAARMSKPYVALPTRVVRVGLRILRRLRLSRYGPEQVAFLEHRPVLVNTRLKEEFGYTPRLSSREVFELYWEGQHAA